MLILIIFFAILFFLFFYKINIEVRYEWNNEIVNFKIIIFTKEIIYTYKFSNAIKSINNERKNKNLLNALKMISSYIKLNEFKINVLVGLIIPEFTILGIVIISSIIPILFQKLPKASNAKMEYKVLPINNNLKIFSVGRISFSSSIIILVLIYFLFKKRK